MDSSMIQILVKSNKVILLNLSMLIM